MQRTVTAAPSRIPKGATPEGDGIALGEGPVVVEAYIDFLCPFCRMFEESSGPALDQMVADRIITLVYHPMAFLDRLSTDQYSSRAASASGCASDGGRFAPYRDALFANQPPEGGPGLADEQLVELGRAAGLEDEAFARCVTGHAYVEWTRWLTERAAERGVSGTPSTFVQGVPVPANARTIAAAVAAVVR
jgi:protein-disulfide isomerase